MSRLSRRIDRFEEIVIALLMAAMTIVSFGQVVARYLFNTGWIGALDITRILFAWLILFGMGYGVKIGTHLGVDTFVRMLPRRGLMFFGIFGALCTFLYAAIFFSADWLQLFGLDANGGAFSYWLRTVNTGIGLTEVRYPEWAQHMFGLPDRVHRWVAYLILPLGLVILGIRSLQGAFAIAAGRRDMITASHEFAEPIQSGVAGRSDGAGS